MTVLQLKTLKKSLGKFVECQRKEAAAENATLEDDFPELLLAVKLLKFSIGLTINDMEAGS